MDAKSLTVMGLILVAYAAVGSILVSRIDARGGDGLTAAIVIAAVMALSVWIAMAIRKRHES